MYGLESERKREIHGYSNVRWLIHGSAWGVRAAEMEIS